MIVPRQHRPIQFKGRDKGVARKSEKECHGLRMGARNHAHLVDPSYSRGVTRPSRTSPLLGEIKGPSTKHVKNKL